MLMLMSLIGLVLTLIFGTLVYLNASKSIKDVYLSLEREDKNRLEKKEMPTIYLDKKLLRKRMKLTPKFFDESEQVSLSHLIKDQEPYYLTYGGLGFSTGIFLLFSQVFSLIRFPRTKGKTDYYLVPHKAIRAIYKLAEELDLEKED